MADALIVRRGGGEKKGKYAWKRYNAVYSETAKTEKKTLTFSTLSSNSPSYIGKWSDPCTAYASYDISKGLVLIGPVETTYGELATNTALANYYVVWNGVLYTDFSSSNTTHLYSNKNITITTTTTFEDYVFSDDSDAYPDKGPVVGTNWYYERTPQLARGTITAPTINPQSLSIAGLDFEPTGFLLTIYEKPNAVYSGQIITVYKNGTDERIFWNNFNSTLTLTEATNGEVTFEYANGVYTITQHMYKVEYYEGYYNVYAEFSEGNTYVWTAWRD